MSVEFEPNSESEISLESPHGGYSTENRYSLKKSRLLRTLLIISIVVAFAAAIFIFLNAGKVDIPDSQRAHGNGKIPWTDGVSYE